MRMSRSSGGVACGDLMEWSELEGRREFVPYEVMLWLSGLVGTLR